MVHEESALSCEGGGRKGLVIRLLSHVQDTSGTADQLANCRAHLLGEISIGSLVEPEDSKCSRWPGNLH